MNRNERKELRATFGRLKTRGLRDIKFFLNSGIDAATTDEVCSDVNAFLCAIEQGKVVEHRWGDSHGKLAPAT